MPFYMHLHLILCKCRDTKKSMKERFHPSSATLYIFFISIVVTTCARYNKNDFEAMKSKNLLQLYLVRLCFIRHCIK